MIILPTVANEGSYYQPAIPSLAPDATSATWSLSDMAGNIINSRLRVPIPEPESLAIVLSGLDLPCDCEGEACEMAVTIEAKVIVGEGVHPFRQAYKFVVASLPIEPAPPIPPDTVTLGGEEVTLGGEEVTFSGA